MNHVVVLVLLLSSASGQVLVFYPGQSTFHQTGTQQGNAWTVTVADPSQRYMTYGPYTPLVKAGLPYRADFSLSIDNWTADDVDVLRVEVNDADDQVVIASRTIVRTDFVAGLASPRNFSLFFTCATQSSRMEFRVFYSCCSQVTHWVTVVRPLVGGPFTDEFWDAAAIRREPGATTPTHFQLIATANFSTTPSDPGSAMANVGSDFVSINGTWFLFYREFFFEPTPSYCTNVLPPARIVLRSSDDHGKTWSDKVVIATPVPNTASECALVDGAAYFDAEESTWHYLSQCIARSGGWSMCHYSAWGSDPMSITWTPNPANPVVRGGQLFSQICAGSGKHCLTDTVDEGTPDIVSKTAEGYFVVTFHGFAYTEKKSARGVASTRDFVTWKVDGFDLPDDAIFSSTDCNPWNITWAAGGCVGGGQGSVMQDGDYFYHLIEAPDLSLACLTTPGEQNWVYGLLRSPTMYAPSGQWQQIQQNPFVFPWVKIGCTLQYNRLFQDDDGVFLSYWVIDYANNRLELQIFQLQSGAGLVPIIAKPSYLTGKY
eukprot:TRINITY_DN18525_c0_g1_i1.p1 TRINITY_DN18525_c0_g1~~TRINITY_DN18525_c0_g1_i1.p1  ORF type:complete len:544 (+),score=170.09 TRINITY_DN18525_c0_g1_i1:155-1786(+)